MKINKYYSYNNNNNNNNNNNDIKYSLYPWKILLIMYICIFVWMMILGFTKAQFLLSEHGKGNTTTTTTTTTNNTTNTITTLPPTVPIHTLIPLPLPLPLPSLLRVSRRSIQRRSIAQGPCIQISERWTIYQTYQNQWNGCHQTR